MKKIFSILLLFTAFLSQAQTYQTVLDLINSNLQSGTKITAVKHREVEIALLDLIQVSSDQQFDVKAIYVNSTYLGNNFEANGLGKNLRLGWAICNGNNGTPNIGGRSIVGYGGDFTTLNATGGSKDAVVVSHSHLTNTNITFGSGDGISRQRATASTGGIGNVVSTETVGEVGTNKNMHPYIVLVYIMKL